MVELENERDALQAELDAIANRAVGQWLTAEHFGSLAVSAMEQTLSWKVTKPLRTVRSAQLRRGNSQKPTS
ncbi:hypothetical protein GCM10009563_25000 [Subtercola frigoramans]